MRRPTLHTLAIILALSALGCEREDLRYPSPDTEPAPTDTTQVVTPQDDAKVRDLAARTAGVWSGTLDTRYVDFRGMTVTKSCRTQMTFLLDEAKAVGGMGVEVDSLDGKQVFRMSFDWQVGGDGRLCLVYADTRTMYSSLYTFRGRSLTLRLVKNDGLETDDYQLERVGPN